MSSLPEFINELKAQLELETMMRGRWVDLAILLRKDGTDFVTACYIGLLDRAPDPEGQEYYLGRLANGDDKLGLLLEIYASQEAAKVGKILYCGTRDRIVAPDTPPSVAAALVDGEAATAAMAPTGKASPRDLGSLEAGDVPDFLRLAGALVCGRSIPPDLADSYRQKIDAAEITRSDALFDLVVRYGYAGLPDFSGLPPSFRPVVQSALGVKGSLEVGALSDQINRLQARLDALQLRVVDQEAQLRTFRYAFALQDRLLDLLAPPGQ